MKTKITNLILFTCSLVFLTWLTACDSGSSLNSAVCGNNIKEGTEVCDGTDVDAGLECSEDCSVALNVDPLPPAPESLCADDLDNDGDLAIDCNDSDCIADAACTGTPVCGNGSVESGEDCDGGDNCNATTCKFLNTGIDDDQDGYTTLKDCNDSDATIHEGAVEIPEDGIDQDCTGKDSLVATRIDTYSTSGATTKIITYTFDSGHANWNIWPFLDLFPDEWMGLMGTKRITKIQIDSDGDLATEITWDVVYEGETNSIMTLTKTATTARTYSMTNTTADGDMSVSIDSSQNSVGADFDAELDYDSSALLQTMEKTKVSDLGSFTFPVVSGSFGAPVFTTGRFTFEPETSATGSGGLGALFGTSEDYTVCTVTTPCKYLSLDFDYTHSSSIDTSTETYSIVSTDTLSEIKRTDFTGVSGSYDIEDVTYKFSYNELGQIYQISDGTSVYTLTYLSTGLLDKISVTVTGAVTETIQTAYTYAETATE